MLPRQNFSVGENRPNLLVLKQRHIGAWWRWWKLYRQEDVWTDQEKRAAMFRARWEYQEAVLNLLEAERAR